MSNILAFSNQKGGVGKTTSAVNVALSLAVSEIKTLLIDLDPQANATTGLSELVVEEKNNIYDAILGHENVKNCITKTSFSHLDIITSTNDLVGAEIELVGVMAREYQLKKAIKNIEKKYDIIIIDCPPSLGLLTINALTASSAIVIPIQCEYYALEGLGPAALASVTNLDDLRVKFPELTDAADIAISKFKEAKELEFDAKIDQARAAASAALAAGNKDLMFANLGLIQVLEKRKNAEIALAESQLAVQQQQTIVAQQKLAVATLTAEQAERAKALTLLKTNKYLGAFNTFLLQSAGTLTAFTAIDDFSDRTAGSGATFDAIQFDTSMFDLPFEQLNDRAINSITQMGKGVLSGSKDAERDANQFAKNILLNYKIQLFNLFRSRKRFFKINV